ncbi:hypothetical protein Tco_0770627 [Tanacetum coccineum]|uniref:Uncharacterized protein n=1 Tax=Tanacetum coccineum TaxID=301880 RepID=A0ABQ4ZFE8_9ASTR
MYHKKNVDYAYLLWEDFVYQVENKNVKRSNEMYYPRFTKVIVNFFMTKDQSIPRRNNVNWHFARDDPMFTTIKVVSRHEDTQLYGAILPIDLKNEAIKDSESYKEYYAIASGAKPPKTNASVKKKQVGSDKAKTPPSTKGKRLKTTAKVTKPSMKKQPTQGLETLSEVALTKEEQMRIVTKRSLTEFHSSHASRSGADEGTGVTPGVPDVPKYGSDDEHISWKSSSDEDDDAESENDDDNDDADNQDDDGHEYDEQDDEEQGDDDEQTNSDKDGDDFIPPKFSTHDEEDKEEDSFDPRVQTPSHVESTDDEDSSCLFNPIQNKESTSLVDVSVTTIVEPPLLSATTLLPPPTPLITHLQQTPVPTPTTVPSSSLQDLPNFDSLFGFDHRLKTLENDFLEFKQTNQFSDKLRDEAQAENEDFINKLDENIKKIIKDQVKEQVKAQVSKILPKIEKIVNEQLEAETLTRSSNESQTSHAIAANLSELELKKILIDKMESNKCQDDEDKDQEPSAGSNRGSKRKRAGKEPESTSAPKEKTSKTTGKSTEGFKSHHKSADESAQAEEPMHTTKDLEEPAHQEFKTGVTKDQPDEETSQHPDWIQKPTRPPSLDCDWNKTLPDAHRPVQP